MACELEVVYEEPGGKVLGQAATALGSATVRSGCSSKPPALLYLSLNTTASSSRSRLSEVVAAFVPKACGHHSDNEREGAEGADRSPTSRLWIQLSTVRPCGIQEVNQIHEVQKRIGLSRKSWVLPQRGRRL